MKKKFIKYLISNWIKIFTIFFFVLLSGAYVSTLAVFTPGQTLDPNCPPTDPDCIVSGNPWLTSSGGIYYDDGDVNVGSSTGTVNSYISGQSSYSLISIRNFTGTESFDTIPKIVLNNDGNPVVVYYSTPHISGFNFVKVAEASGNNSSMVIIVCSDPDCNDTTGTIIDTGFYSEYDFNPSIVIDSDNIPHVIYMEGDNNNIKYASCSDENCSSSFTEDVVYGGDGWNYNYNVALSNNNTPYIIFNSYNNDTSLNEVSIARYTGTGTENTCSYYDQSLNGGVGDYAINNDWKCNVVSSDLNYNNMVNGFGDFMRIGSNGYPVFISANYDDMTGDSYLSYNVCSNTDCSSKTSTSIDFLYLNGGTIFSLDFNNLNTPYISYIEGNNSEYLKLAYYVGGGDGSGCSESDDWTCRTVSTVANITNDYYWYLDLEIDNNNLPKIALQEYLISTDSYNLIYFKCLDSTCATTSNITLFEGGTNANYLSGVFDLNSDNEASFVYFDIGNLNLVFNKETISSNTSFGSGSNNLYTGGDLGITDNLFVDGKTALGGGLYLSDYVPDVTSNALYNDEGDLYWNGVLLNEVVIPQWTDTYTYGGITLTLPGTSGTIATTNGSINYATSAGSASSASTANQLTTTRSIYGNNFNGTANVTGIISATYGGTGNGFTAFTGPATSTKTFTLPNASATILTTNSAVTVAQGGTGLTTLTANNLLVGAGTGNVTFIAPGTSGNVLTSNGTTWTSTAPTLVSNADYNTLAGTGAGSNLVSGSQYNTLLGYQAGISGSSGGTNISDHNTAIGYQSLYSNTTGYQNTVVGSRALYSNTTGRESTAIGYRALYSNITGSSNTAFGEHSLFWNETGSGNTAQGLQSLYFSGRGVEASYLVSGFSYTIKTIGTTDFTLVGASSNSVGEVFIATGAGSGTGTVTSNSNDNVAIGVNAGSYIPGVQELSEVSNSVFIGRDTKALNNGSNNEIVIGYNTTGNGSNTVTIGNSSITKTYLRGLNLAAGTATAGTAPLKLTSGTALTTTEAGAIEFHSGHLYFTATNGGSRYQLDSALTNPMTASGDIIYGGTAGAPLSLAKGNNGDILYLSGGVPAWISQYSSGALQIVNSSNLFSKGLTGTGFDVTATTHSIFLGENAGYSATAASSSIFLGNSAGYNSDSADYSNFLGNLAGYNSSGSEHSNFLGYQAGSSTTAYYSNFLGTSAGDNATNATSSNFLGYFSGYYATSAIDSNFLGNNSGYQASGASNSNFLGALSGRSATNSSYSNFLGRASGQDSTNASNSNFLGNQAGYSAPSASNSNFLGYQAGYNADNARNSIFIGQNAGTSDTVNTTSNADDFAILIGKSTSTGGFKNSIALGGSATNTAENQFMIGSTTRPINTTIWNTAGGTTCTLTSAGLTCTSDEDLKTNISDLELDTLEKIIKIKTVRYNWLEYKEGDKKNIGFLAEDLNNYFPELVSIDVNNNMSVNYANMTPILVEAIREMDLKVTKLEELSLVENSSLGNIMNSFFEDTLEKVEDGIAYIRSLVVGKLKVGSEERRTGITLYDEETGEPYCISVVNGEMINKEGECGIIEVPDVCPNIDEYQTEIPEGYELDENNECVEIEEQDQGEGQGEEDAPPLPLDEGQDEANASGTTESV